MIDYSTQIGDLPSKLASSKRVLVALSAKLSQDNLASALSLALALQNSGKTVVVVSEGTLLVSHSDLYGIGEIKNFVPSSGEGNFVIKLDGVVDPTGQLNTVPSLEKLDWYPEGSALNLVFHVVPGQRFEPNDISYGHENSGFDLVVAVDADSLDELGQVYLKNAALFSKSTVVNIDNDPSNTQFGNINILDTQVSSISEMMVGILKNLNLEMDSDIASNLVSGIYTATANLTQKVSPETFSAVSVLMQAGGKLPEGGQIEEKVLEVSEAPKVAEAENSQPVNQIQFNQSTAPSQQQTATQAPLVEPAVEQQPVIKQTQPAVETQAELTPVSAQASDLYSNPFLNPGGQPTAPSLQTTVTQAPQNQGFAAPTSGPTFNFGSVSEPTTNSQQPTATQPVVEAPQLVSTPEPVKSEPVDMSGPLSTIMQANQKDDAYDLKQVFKVEQMPDTPVTANTTVDSALQQSTATSQQQPARQVSPVQESKPRPSPEERPVGEAVASTNPEAEANPTPDWLVPKIFKGGSLG